MNTARGCNEVSLIESVDYNTVAAVVILKYNTLIFGDQHDHDFLARGWVIQQIVQVVFVKVRRTKKLCTPSTINNLIFDFFPHINKKKHPRTAGYFSQNFGNIQYYPDSPMLKIKAQDSFELIYYLE